MQAKDDHPNRTAGDAAHGLSGFVDREIESRRLSEAIRKRESLMIFGPAGIGKTALVKEVIRGLPPDLAARCLCLGAVKDLQDLLRQLIHALYDLKDPNLRHQLHAEGVPVLAFEAWLKALTTSRLKGTLWRTVERGDYRVFLDHLPSLTHPIAKIVKELFWMRNTPVYLLIRGEQEQHVLPYCRFFYWTDRERLGLQPLPTQAAAELLESSIERFGLSRLDLADFREEALALSKRVPGAIVKMCSLARHPRYQQGSRIKIKSIYIDYLMRGRAAPGENAKGSQDRA